MPTLSVDTRSLNPCIALTKCASAVLLLCAAQIPAYSRDYFNPAFLEHPGSHAATATDLSTFDTDETQSPGRYYVDIYLNENFIEKRNVDFQLVTTRNGQKLLQGCLTTEQLKRYGVKTDLNTEFNRAADCADITIIPAAEQHFDFQNQKLFISVPQAWVSNAVRGYISPDQWDEGINALMMNYSLNGYRTSGSDDNDDNSDSTFIALQPGVNVGPWRLRHYSTLNMQNSGGERTQQWSAMYSYLQRDIVALKSQFVAGDSNTSADVFDSAPFRGLQIASDDQMLPNSQRGYAPVIRGVARSNAQIIIRQNGRIAYQTAVAPGNFEITDMYPTGSSGDYDVTVKESDGSEQHFIVPYSSLPILQREGQAKYSLTAGQYRDGNHAESQFAQATLIYGLPHGMTLYGGSQAANDRYLAFAFGIGQNLAVLGAVTVDNIWSRARFEDGRQENGQSWRMRYSKGVLSTGTNISIAGYRYASEGYNTLQDVMEADSGDDDRYGKRHNRFEATLNQQLGDRLGSLSVSWVKENYWNSAQRMESLGVGYSNSWKQISYSLNYSYNRNTWQHSGESNLSESQTRQNDQTFTFAINVPFSLFESHVYAHYALNTRKNGATVNSTSLSGSMLQDNQLNWSLQQSHSDQDGDSAGFSASYQGRYGDVSAGYNGSPDSQQLSYGFTGGMVAHANGITFSQPITGSAVLVKAPGASDVPVIDQTGVSTDFRGYTVIPNVAPYSRYDISLDSRAFEDDVDLPTNSQPAIPTRDAIVRVEFDVRKGYRSLMTLSQRNGETIPFGATVTADGQNEGNASIVGNKGQVYLSGLTEKGELVVKWGQNAHQRCRAAYRLDPNQLQHGMIMASAICQ